MADTIKTSYELGIGLDYEVPSTSGTTTKTAYIKLPNPKSELTESSIRSEMATFINEQIILDPQGNAFSTSSIATAYTLTEEKIDIDIDG